VSGIAWPDVVAALVVLFGALKGFKRGLVAELTGALALGFSIVAAFRYPGMWDAWLATHAGAARGASHVVGMIAYALVAYVVVQAFGSVLGTIAKLPLVGFVNNALGAAAGIAKSIVLLWAIVYAALFFPLPQAVRDDLHRSSAVAALQTPNARFDATLRGSLPAPLAPFASALFGAHRV